VRNTLAPIAEAHGATPVQAAIAWTLHQPGITAAIVGARNPAQVEENAAAGALELTEEELKTMGRVFSELDLTRA
jgi:methylglyoxal reductase